MRKSSMRFMPGNYTPRVIRRCAINRISLRSKGMHGRDCLNISVVYSRLKAEAGHWYPIRWSSIPVRKQESQIESSGHSDPWYRRSSRFLQPECPPINIPCQRILWVVSIGITITKVAGLHFQSILFYIHICMFDYIILMIFNTYLMFLLHYS